MVLSFASTCRCIRAVNPYLSKLTPVVVSLKHLPIYNLIHIKSNQKIVCHVGSKHRNSSALFGSQRGKIEFAEACEETLQNLSEYFEELVESQAEFKNGDVAYIDGVLTVGLGNGLGTYVINRQTPNQQIWLSSPTSGPKRYDFVDGVWIYKHDKTTLHSLLDREIAALTKAKVSFSAACSFQEK